MSTVNSPMKAPPRDAHSAKLGGHEFGQLYPSGWYSTATYEDTGILKGLVMQKWPLYREDGGVTQRSVPLSTTAASCSGLGAACHIASSIDT